MDTKLRSNRSTRTAKSMTSDLAAAPPTAPMYRCKVGDLVDVLCDHSRNGERVRDWLQGIVVQADYKMVAVQFVEDVYLTDGWMVPDRILFCQQGATNIRASTRRRVRRSRRVRPRRK
jgi:exosome complex RNA-binding protein Rrp42 (RNase PH superfamily)